MIQKLISLLVSQHFNLKTKTKKQ